MPRDRHSPSDGPAPYELEGHTLRILAAAVHQCIYCDCYRWPGEPKPWARRGAPYAYQVDPPPCLADRPAAHDSTEGEA